MPRKKKPKTLPALLEFALGLPETHEDHPWGETVVKVNKKVFVFLGREDPESGDFGFSVKLPDSGFGVLAQPFASPTGYGLGKSGWVTLRFPNGDHPPAELLCEWIEESYRAVAPKKLSKQLLASSSESEPTVGPARPTPKKKKKAAPAKASKKAAPKPTRAGSARRKPTR